MKKNETIHEFETIEDELDCYIVKFPDDDLIESTVDSLRQYVPNREKEIISTKERLRELVIRVSKDFTFIHKGFWIVSCLLLLTGYYIANVSVANPLFILVLFAPLPFALGLLEVFRGRDKGMLEMEMACKHSVYEVVLSKLLIISIYNIVLIGVLTVLLMPNLSHYSLWEVSLIWMTPFTWFVASALFLSIHFRGVVFSSLFTGLWVLFSTFLLSQHRWAEALVHLNVALHVVLLLVGLALCLLQLKRMARKFSSFEEVGTSGISY
ncbi:hypothetical protein [Bacillus sp. JCM 19034]|uniref:hypothetical protein n=1 Tax=Bacillus sp. JCM 19034 TaxID=1481928 RepID=UPI000780F989|nr:hypothetical protein [Bacillus sp. JCM 19034]